MAKTTKNANVSTNSVGAAANATANANAKTTAPTSTLAAALAEARRDFDLALVDAGKHPSRETGTAAVAAGRAAIDKINRIRNLYPETNDIPTIDLADARIRAQIVLIEEKVAALGAVVDENAIGKHRDKVKAEIKKMALAVAAQFEAVLATGQRPFAHGPTGCGKSWGAKLLAEKKGWGLEYRSGTETTTSVDLVGTPLPGGLMVEGVIARAFRRARAGETIQLVLDEIPRFPQRTLDVILPAMDEISPATAALMGIVDDNGKTPTEPIFCIEEALWPRREWAPASKIKWVLAGNPWGTPVDPALASRTQPFAVTYPESLAACFSEPMKKTIEASWKGARPGGTISVTLPIDPRALEVSVGPDDPEIVKRYVSRLDLCDASGATGESFLKAAKALGVKGLDDEIANRNKGNK